ncbi:MAG: nascent polypeptide-associated complex protein [Candidatus Micrarchaeota archaeon]|nr:nascent polypeptide-associated complex protein [Candidatus Micrarchaeota archaeon]
MFGPNLDPKQLAKMLKQFGIESKNIEANRVIIETSSNKIIITQPQVIEINYKGENTYQISGKIEKEPIVKEEELELIVQQTGCSREKALEALKKADYDIAKAILEIEQEKQKNS